MKIQNSHRPARAAGFSLAELMVVLVIIGLLATVVVRNVLPNLFKAQDTKVKADITTIITALDEWAMLHNGSYPDTLDVLVQEDENGQKALKQDTVPKDPWGVEYGYDAPQRGTTDPRVFTYGKDGVPVEVPAPRIGFGRSRSQGG